MVPSINLVGILSMSVALALAWLLKPVLPIPALSAILFGASLYVMGSIAKSKILVKNSSRNLSVRNGYNR
jgi:hypothetical protein